MDKGADFIVERDSPTLVARMNALTGGSRCSTPRALEREIVARDRELDNPFSKDMQIIAIRGARRYLGDRLIRTAKPHRLLDPAAGPLIAVRLHILTRKTLGGLRDRPRQPRAGRRRPADAGALCGGRGRGLRRRRHARLPRARRHVPRRLHLLRARGGSRGGQSSHLNRSGDLRAFHHRP